MKKMNLSFLGLNAKVVLTLFLFLGLFMFSATSVSAQYVNSSEAKVIIDQHISSLPVMTASLRARGHAMTPKMVEESKNELRHKFGSMILHNIGEGKSVKESIDAAYDFAKDRIPAEWLNAVKQEYVQLLTD